MRNERFLVRVGLLVVFAIVVLISLYGQPLASAHPLLQSPPACEPALPNDNFADAEVVTGLPAQRTANNNCATREVAEPVPFCVVNYSGFGRTVWYAYTPNSDASLTASLSPYYYYGGSLAVWAGSDLQSLQQIACNGAIYGYVGSITFRPQSGSTYYFQIGSVWDAFGEYSFNLNLTPPPVVSFSNYPYDASVYESIQFYDTSYDPGGMGFQDFAWNFGDGSTASGSSSIHRYAKDGDYTVTHSATTTDGRTASTSQMVTVKTHDVAITKFSVPQSARAGQTRQIVVGINSKLYPETVRVELMKGSPTGSQVGQLVQSVPVRASNRTTDFNFSYTFTKEDAQVGKVNFTATATIINARDALSSDNSAISMPTKVSGATANAADSGSDATNEEFYLQSAGVNLYLPVITH